MQWGKMRTATEMGSMCYRIQLEGECKQTAVSSGGAKTVLAQQTIKISMQNLTFRTKIPHQEKLLGVESN